MGALLRELGWWWDFSHADQVLCRLARSPWLEDGALPRTEDLGEAVCRELLPEDTPEYLNLRDAVDVFLVEHLLQSYDLEQLDLPLPGHRDTSSESELTVPVFMSRGAMAADVLLVLQMGKGESRAPAWVSSVCIYKGLRFGASFTYVEEALNRGWGVLILNPNFVCALVDTDGSDGQGGPAPPELIEQLAEAGFPALVAHHACLWTRCVDGDTCMEAISKRFDTGIDLFGLEPLVAGLQCKRLRSIPCNESPEAHTNYVFRNLIFPHSAAGSVLFAGTSYAGTCLAKLLDESGDELAPRLKAVVFADSAHHLDCADVAPSTAQVLEAVSRNWIPAITRNTKGISVVANFATGEKRLHSWCVSAGAVSHAECPGAIVAFAFEYFDSHLAGTIERTGNKPV